MSAIRSRLQDSGTTLAGAIEQRDLYFRVSLVGACNLSCAFCHNEGAPTRGKLDLGAAGAAFRAAAEVGFRRVQLTGGEPLLRPDVAAFVAEARRSFDDVGVTTNGVYLPRRIDGLIEAGLRRIHVSLQTESLALAGSQERWDIPDWLQPAIAKATEARIDVRVNLPVPADRLPQAEAFLGRLQTVGVSAKVFSVLPEGEVKGADAEAYPLQHLADMVDRFQPARHAGSSVVMRGYRAPAGLRCSTCADHARCMEQSHSLRLGSDLVLRPCLATRRWDSVLDPDAPERSIAEAALLAIDYVWPS